MKNKKLVGIIVAAIAVILVCFGVIYVNQAHKDTAQTSQSNSTGLKIQRTKHSNTQSSKSEDNYSNDEWMLMGYMAYAHDNYVQSRHIQNNSDLVTDVSEDLDDGSLKVEKNSANTYTLSNKFGSVDVTVEEDDVKVENDGTTTTSKTELKRTFAQFENKIQSMTKNISEDGNSDSDANNSSSTKNDSDDSDSSNQEFNDQEFVVAAYVDGFDGSTPEEKINNINNMISKDQNSDLKNFPRDQYLSGLYHGTFKKKPYYTVASSFSTSAYTIFYLNGNGNEYITQPGGANLGMTEGEKKYKSKQAIIDKYASHKSDIDKILQGLEYNKKQMPIISEKMNKEAERQMKDN